MRTVSSLCATAAIPSLAAVGLSLARDADDTSHSPSPNRASEMTAVASPYPHSSPFSFSKPLSTDTTSERRSSRKARVGEKRTLDPTTTFEHSVLQHEEENGSRVDSRSQSWLRRLSSGMSTSRASSQGSMSRPESQSNASLTWSQADSSTRMFPEGTPPRLAPNKLVKRAPTQRSASSPLLQGSGSRLPLPARRRIATSHQRSAEMQGRHSGTVSHSDSMMLNDDTSPSRAHLYRPYFTPKVPSVEGLSASRRTSTGIPNPIKRVYPDRKYTPVLVSTSTVTGQPQVELDDRQSSEGGQAMHASFIGAGSSSSSPLPSHAFQFDQEHTPRRSFSISDLLSSGPQPLWRRPSRKGNNTSGSKLPRKPRPRVASAPQAVMGGVLSSNNSVERPTKRRDLTDPRTRQRSIYTTPNSIQQPYFEARHEVQLNLSDDARGPTNLSANHSPPLGTPLSSAQAQNPDRQQSLAPATDLSNYSQPIRVSATQSEISSFIGSDSEYRSVGDFSTDDQSERVYDSIPTRTTQSSSGRRRGPHIETIFDDSPPFHSSGRSKRLKDLLHDGAFDGDESLPRERYSTIDEEESMASTPVRSLRNNSVTSTPSAGARALHQSTSYPPALATLPDPDEMDWDAFDAESSDGNLSTLRGQASLANHTDDTRPALFTDGYHRDSYDSAAERTAQRSHGINLERANLFEWSEAQPSPGQTRSPPRPRTVHGKKDPESRGSRSATRRAPSGMHARSHSVPVVPDVDGKRNNVVANKFGTWGVGSKVITEDWNDDFDFDEPASPLPEHSKIVDRRMDSGHEMVVPRSIREQQDNVVANIHLLREWGLLIEELKELRIRAVALDMLTGPYAQAWQEVDAMIELADQETQEHTLEPRRSPPSSPGFDYDDFEENMPNIAETLQPPVASSDFTSTSEHPKAASTSPGRQSPRQSTPRLELSTRPRKDSEAVARSVIEALQAKRSVSDPTALVSAPQSNKVPFDTGTLRHIVPYVSGLKRRIKDALRETEGLRTSPARQNTRYIDSEDEDIGEPDFRSIFNEPVSSGGLAPHRSRREQAATDHDGFDDGFDDVLEQPEDNLAKRIQDMSLPR